MLEKFHQIKQSNEDELLIEVHDTLMRQYGYIGIEEMKNIPIPTVLEMLGQIERYNKMFKKRIGKR